MFYALIFSPQVVLSCDIVYGTATMYYTWDSWVAWDIKTSLRKA